MFRLVKWAALCIIGHAMTTNEAWDLVGGLSSPSKLPCYGYSIPARHCITGKKLHNVEGSVCSNCYALKGRYAFANVQNALDRRFASLQNPRWVEAMVYLIGKLERSGYFRWHDSGDLQGVWHLELICKVAQLTPNVKHWLPTRELSIVREYREKKFFPSNLCVRLSGFMVDGTAPTAMASTWGCATSTVVTTGANCPAPKQGNKCLDCRACWDVNKPVAYAKH